MRRYEVVRTEQVASLQRREDELTVRARRGEELETTLSTERTRLDAQDREITAREDRCNALEKVLDEQKEMLEVTRVEIQTKAKVTFRLHQRHYKIIAVLKLRLLNQSHADFAVQAVEAERAANNASVVEERQSLALARQKLESDRLECSSTQQRLSDLQKMVSEMNQAAERRDREIRKQVSVVKLDYHSCTHHSICASLWKKLCLSLPPVGP